LLNYDAETLGHKEIPVFKDVVLFGKRIRQPYVIREADVLNFRISK
jgi:hypothetical protein